MLSEREIGRVVAIDTSQVTVELSRDLKALTKSTYEGTLEIGQINSYIIIPVGSIKVVAMVTRVVLTEESELKANRTMVSLPSSRRIMKATMIGTIDEEKFHQGISIFPVLDTPVMITSKDDLDTIFGNKNKSKKTNLEKPGYCITIGKSTVFPDYNIRIDPDIFFGKHTAIIGSTGSGKSCSIATILQSIIREPKVKNTRFVVLDTNGEYRNAFQKQNKNKKWINAIKKSKILYIPTDRSVKEKLTIPYWFMNSDDFVRLFRAAPGVQRPVLINALSSARENSSQQNWINLRESLIWECNKLLQFANGGTWQDRNSIRVICDGVIHAINNQENEEVLKELLSQYNTIDKEYILNTFDHVKRIAGRRDGNDYDPLGMQNRQKVNDLLDDILSNLINRANQSMGFGSSSSDSPRYFKKSEFRYRYLEDAMSRDVASVNRTRDNCSTMLMRIYRLLEDSRFEFLFGRNNIEWPDIKHALATFLRDIIGIESGNVSDLSNTSVINENELSFYDRQRGGAKRSNVVIIDLSLLASEILENVTALIGRLIHEFLQRISDPISGINRGDFPIVLILEEAQNYIREVKLEEESISKQVFERIAREGRKYGLGLVIASQRPSELSKTVLSQCNSFIVHRLQNPEDLRYFREIVPGVYNQLLDQLPALAPRNALVLGECIQAPALVEMREADPIPKSKNPFFYKSWVKECKQPDFEKVCAAWEGKLRNDK